MELTKKELAIILSKVSREFTGDEQVAIIGERIYSLSGMLEYIEEDVDTDEEAYNLMVSGFNKMVDALLDENTKYE